MTRPKAVTIRILDREFQVACPPEERDELFASAEYLNQRMREIRDGGKVIGIDRIAVIAALNLAHELLRQQNREQRVETHLMSRIRNIQQKIEVALNTGKQMEL